MKIRLAILALLLVVAVPLLLLVLHRAEQRESPSHDVRAPGREAPPAAAGDSIPGPDARLLIAAGDLRRILSGASGTVDAVRMYAGWRLIVRGRGGMPDVTIGYLADHAGFEGLTHVLVLHARHLLAESRPVEAVLADAAGSAYRLSCIALAVPDPMGLSDPFAARALAALAIAEASGDARLERARALLAQAMGYTDEATREAESLDAADPARTCLLGPSAVLSASAHAPGATFETRLLWRHRLAALDPRAWEAEAAADDPVLAATGLGIGAAGKSEARSRAGHVQVAPAAAQRDARRAIAAVFERVLEGDAGLPDLQTATPAALAERFEQALLALPEAGADPFGDRAIARTLYPVIFYAALARLAATTGGTPQPELAARDPYAAAGRAAAFATWCWLRTIAATDLNDPTKAQLRLRLLRWFGPPALLALRDALRDRLPDGHPLLRGIDGELRLRMDLRPAHRGAAYLEAAGMTGPS